MSATTWRTDDPCPVCGTGLTATDDGNGDTPGLRAVRLVGHLAGRTNLDGGEVR